MEKEKSLINLDNNSLAILQVSKSGLEKIALELKSKLDALTEYEALYKLQYLIKYRMECIKESSVEEFINKFEGSSCEKENGFTVTLKQLSDYAYSDNVKNLEIEIKALQEQLKQQKEKEKKVVGKTLKSENIALTLH